MLLLVIFTIFLNIMAVQLVLLTRSYNLIKDLILVNVSKTLSHILGKKSKKIFLSTL